VVGYHRWRVHAEGAGVAVSVPSQSADEEE
jgi:hypothetical protein